jgi:hypothetical protein
MVTLEEDVDGPQGSWLVVSMLWRLDLAVANLAGACVAIEQLVKGFQLLFLHVFFLRGGSEGLRARVTARAASRGTSRRKQRASMHLSWACISRGRVSLMGVSLTGVHFTGVYLIGYANSGTCI